MRYHTSLKDKVRPLEGLVGVCMSVEVEGDRRTRGECLAMQGKLY